MMHDRRLWLLLLLAAFGGWQWWQGRPVEQPPGERVASVPAQSPSAASAIVHGGYELQRRAHYDITARLLSRRAYRFGREAALSPVDFALGWGVMSRTEVLDAMQIRQSGRYFSLRWQTPPAPPQEILDSAANMHLIPADASVARSLDRMRPGQVVRLQGLLVDAIGADGWRWSTSLTRSDRGRGACELMYVQSAAIIP
ncbi:hypothetical protein [Panacagrimonas sp.]|uniref:hypothetical protein n=1 Tax=Panacagrimonas sp. TaxID=2480088 RepID=UPI003B52B5FC